VKALIDEGAENGQASMGFGGLWEPLMSRDLPEIISYGKEKGLLDVMFNTNGLLLNDNVAKDLIKSGLTRLMISVDAATPATYAQMRPGADLRQLEDNILSFLAGRREAKSRLPLLRLSFLVTNINQSEVTPFLDRWKNRVDFFSIQSFGRFDQNAPALFPDSSPSNLADPNNLPRGRCAQPQKRLLVRHDSTVLPCCDLSGLSLTLGRVDQGGLKPIWTGSRISSLRRDLQYSSLSELPQACQNCQTKFDPNR
jgi:radical SAM protein with 4Fe4S-binding SPASM domain